MQDFNPVPGQATEIEAGLRRVLAPNPSPMTFRGTNSYLLGKGRVAVIDPGPACPAHLKALLTALRAGESVSHILITHTHADHSALAHPLSGATGAPILAFGRAGDGQSAAMRHLAAARTGSRDEGIDRAFCPDRRLADGERIDGDGWSLTALWTPGHTGNHLCFAWGDKIFTGDHVMGWASSVISPPDGDLTDFMASCTRLKARGDRVYYPGHGPPVANPDVRLDWLIAHRKGREAEILAKLAKGPANIDTLTTAIYRDVPPALRRAASRNILAHLVDLDRQGRVTAVPALSHRAVFALCDQR